MVRTRDQVLHLIRRNKNALRRFGVKRLGLFGSVARNEAKKSSDIDVLVDFEKKSFDAYMDLKMFLEKHLGCPIDLVLSDSVKPRLRKNIFKEVIYA